MKKIYIIGPVGSGKSTLAKALSKKLNIKYYELDMVIWDENERKRTDEEIKEIFDGIMSQDSWIIEDVGRNTFAEGFRRADVVYYIDLKPALIYKRCIMRWIKQKLGLEPYNYKPTLKGLKDMLGWARSNTKKRDKRIASAKELSNNVQLLTLKDVNRMIKEEKYGDSKNK